MGASFALGGMPSLGGWSHEVDNDLIGVAMILFVSGTVLQTLGRPRQGSRAPDING